MPGINLVPAGFSIRDTNPDDLFNTHFSTGFVAERIPQTPTVCLDAVSIVEWRSNAQWKRASDKCKPTP